MRRSTIIAVLVPVAALLGLLAWQSLAREREFGRLLVAGERALAANETFPALEAFSGAIALRNDSMIAHLKRGETYRRRGEMGPALRDLRRAAQLDPDATRPLELLGDVNAELGRFANAADSYAGFVRLDDRSPRVLYKLALARLRLGQAAAALTSLDQALAVDDRLAECHYLKGVCLRTLGRLDEAAAALDRAQRLEPKLTSATEELAELYAWLHRHREAIALLQGLAALEPGRVERQVALALAHSRVGQHDEAVLTLRRAAQEHPESNAVFTAIGRVWLDSADGANDRVAVNKALGALQTVVRRGPATSEALVLLGRAQMLRGDVAAAERSFRQAASRFPIEPNALLHLSLAAERVGHVATARDALARYTALTGDGRPPTERALKLGELSARLNELAAAATWYEKAAAGSPASAQAFVRLAETRLRLKDVPGAAEAVAKGLTVDPKNKALLSLRRTLR
jgi:tetratricopeptide (TPR) repeat protein